MNHVIARFREPSSYAALAAIFAMIGVIIPPDLWQNIVMMACGAAGVMGFVLSEKKK
jgi:uncharacterized membrane protein YccC